MSRLPLRVVKVGGSLLARGDLSSRLNAWLTRQPAAIHVLVCGGGELADVIRRWDEVHGLGEEQSHWLCIRLLSITSSLIASMLMGSIHIMGLSELQQFIGQAREPSRPVVFDLHDFLLNQEPRLPPQPVPHTWSVTTDSLAARLAEVLDADSLILLKSSPPENPMFTWSQLAHAGYVDAGFPSIAERLRQVSWATFDD